VILSRPAIAVAAVLATLLISACGSDGDSAERSEGKIPAAVVARANANCRELRRETTQIGRAVPGNLPPGTLALTTDLLVKPSIPVLERAADRQQALKPAAGNLSFDLYADLFDPIVVLAQKRLAAGETGDFMASKGFDAMLTDFGLEQRRVAQLAGLRDCGIDFEHVLVSALTE
jgi:hypothetical protein